MGVLHFVKRPGTGRTSFAIVRKTTRPDGTSTHETVTLDSLRALNASVKSGALPRADADIQVKQICDGLNRQVRRQAEYTANDANQKMLKRYFREVYDRRRVNKQAAWDRLAQAVDLLGPVSILAEVTEAQGAVDMACTDNPRLHRRVVSALNQIRKHLGVVERLEGEKPTDPPFRYLTEKEVKKVLKVIDCEPTRLLFSVLFHTGVRTGEAFALRPEHYRAPALNVVGQIDRRGIARKPKNGKARKTICLPGGDEDLRKWLALGNREMRPRSSLSNYWRAMCRRAFPSAPSKWTKAHDLRHSFAVHLLVEKGVSMDQIAKLLGNRRDVCEQYYLNFIFEDDTLAAIIGGL